MHVIYIDTVETHVCERLTKLTLQVAGSHAMRAARDVGKTRDSRFDEIFFDILTHITRRRSVKRQVTTFAANNNLVPRKAALSQLQQSRADRSFASLKAIIRSRVYHIRAQLNGAYYRARIASVCFIIS